jgi:hypothetical protein
LDNDGNGVFFRSAPRLYSEDSRPAEIIETSRQRACYIRTITARDESEKKTVVVGLSGLDTNTN